ncbi:STX5 family protein [Megaselia abdita]
MQARRRFAEHSNSHETIEIVYDEDDNKKYNNVPKSRFALPFSQNFVTNIVSGITNITNSTNLTDNKENLISDSEFFLESSRPEEEFIMASRDRTNEFGNAVRSLQSRNITRSINQRDTTKAKQMQSYSEFMNMAKFIGKNLTSTYTKLEKLTLLAKKKSLFEDRPQEIQELTYIIKGDLSALNQQIAKLQEISRRNNELDSKHMISHSSNMVLALQSKLATMSTDFKQILEIRTENLKFQKNRHDQFSQAGSGSSVSKNASTSLLLAEEQHQSSIEMGRQGSHPQNQSQTQLMIYSDESDNYVQQRAETMQNIESTIVELGGIFQQLAHMVKEQEEIVERIDTNIADAEMNIDAAHSEILKYFQSVTKNRWLMIKIFGVLIFFFIFFLVFMS